MASFEKSGNDCKHPKVNIKIRLRVCLCGLRARIKKLINKYFRKEEI
nr:hypothetical protein [Chicken picobirnavirus]